jgi:hypothetical protein
LLGLGPQVCDGDQIFNLLDGEGFDLIAVGGVLLCDLELVSLFKLLPATAIMIITIVSEVSTLYRAEELCGFGSNDAL